MSRLNKILAAILGHLNGALSISGTPVTTASQNVAYAGFTATASGGTAPYTYSLVGSWPTGITVNSSNGIVSGTPTVNGSFTGLSVRVTDNLGAVASLANFSITVAVGMSISGTPVTTATQGIAYAGFTVSAAGGNVPYVYSLTGSWPAGISINSSTGAITGTPTISGSYTGLSVRATDTVGSQANLATFSINVATSLAINGTPATTATQNFAYPGFTATASGGTAPYTYALVGTWPAGVTVDGFTGVVSGTPTNSGSFTGLSIRATDSLGVQAQLSTFSITVAAAMVVTGSPTPPTIATKNWAFPGFTASATGGTGAKTYSLVGTWPNGVTVNPSSGVVSGTPTNAGIKANLSIRATDSLGATSDMTPFTVDVANALNISGTPVTTATQGVVYLGFTATRTGGSAPRTFSLLGTWPTGITIDSDTGLVSGTPTNSGSFTGLSVRVTDAIGAQADLASFNITVAASGVTTVQSLGLMGGNLTSYLDYSKDAMFVDLMKRVRTFAPTSGSQRFNGGFGSINVASMTRSSNVVTVTLNNAPGDGGFTMASGMFCELKCFSDPSFSTSHTAITVTDQTHFSYANTGANVSAVVGSSSDVAGVILGSVPRGAAGHPIADFRAILSANVAPTTGVIDLVGTYLGVFPGTAPSNITVSGGTLSSYTPGGSTFTLTLTLADTSQCAIEFTGVPTDGSFRVPRIIRNDHDQSGSTLLRPDFKDAISRYKTLRMMDSGMTNAHASFTNWAHRPLFNYGLGLSLEEMVQISNENQSDLWYAFPSNVTNEYIDNAATLIRDTLSPSLNCYFEFSNEIWNTVFLQYHWLFAEAKAEAQAVFHGTGGWNEIVSITRTGGNLVTVVLNHAVKYTVGQHIRVNMSGDTSCNEADCIISGVSGNTFTYPSTGSNGAVTLTQGQIYGNITCNLIDVDNAFAMVNRLFIRRTYEVSQRVKTVFGNVLNGRARMVFMWQSGTFSGYYSWVKYMLTYIEGLYGSVDNWMYMLGCAPYASGIGSTALEAVTNMQGDIDAQMDALHSAKYLAHINNVKFGFYECGPASYGESNPANVDAVYAYAGFRDATRYITQQYLGTDSDLTIIFTAGLRWPTQVGYTTWGVADQISQISPIGSTTSYKQLGYDDVLYAARPPITDPNQMPGTVKLVTGANTDVYDNSNGGYSMNGMHALPAGIFMEQLVYVENAGNYTVNVWGKWWPEGGGSPNLEIYLNDTLVGTVAMFGDGTDLDVGPQGGSASTTSLTLTSVPAGWNFVKVQAPSSGAPYRIGASKFVFT